MAFGGAGGQHACAVASLLGIGRVVVPRDAGLLSALGLGAAVVERFAHRQVLEPLDRVGGQVAEWIGELGRQAAEAVAVEGVPVEEVQVRRRILNLRFVGQEEALPIEMEEGEPPERAFAAAYLDIYGYAPEDRAIELESIRVVASSLPAEPAGDVTAEEPHEASPAGTRRAWLGGGWREVPLFDRAVLQPGATFHGPALVFESHAATVVAERWEGRADGAGNLVLSRPALID